MFLLCSFTTLLITSGFSGVRTISPHIANMYSAIFVMAVLNFVTAVICHCAKGMLLRITVQQVLRLWWYFNYLVPFYAFFTLAR